MSISNINDLDWEVLPGRHLTDGAGERIDGDFEEGDWLAYKDGLLVGRVSELGDMWYASCEGELPHLEIGKYKSLSEARSILTTEVNKWWLENFAGPTDDVV